MINYINKHLLPDSKEGVHVIFWPDFLKGKDRRLKHPLFRDSSFSRKYDTAKRHAKPNPGELICMRINNELNNYHLLGGVCLVKNHSPYPDVHLPALQNCLKRVAVYAANLHATIHLSTYPLYFSDWENILPIIRTTCQGLNIIIHKEQLRSKSDGIQIENPMLRLPVQERQILRAT